MCRLFESLRVENGKVVNVIYHQKRVSQSCSLILTDYINGLTLPSHGVHKLRISYSENAFHNHTIEPYQAKTIRTLQLIFDDTIEYSRKWENREALNNLYSKRNGCDDILIIKNGYVTDSSYCNILFYDGTHWITPQDPLLRGSCRERLLTTNRIISRPVKVEELDKFTKFMLINAMLDFCENRSVDLQGAIRKF